MPPIRRAYSTARKWHPFVPPCIPAKKVDFEFFIADNVPTFFYNLRETPYLSAIEHDYLTAVCQSAFPHRCKRIPVVVTIILRIVRGGNRYPTYIPF